MGKGSKLKKKHPKKHPRTPHQQQRAPSTSAADIEATHSHKAPSAPQPSDVKGADVKGATLAPTNSCAPTQAPTQALTGELTGELTEGLTEAPLWRRQPLASLLISLFLGAQLLLPLSYYLGDHPWDERFSWRMFSTVRGLSCEPRLWRGALQGERARPCPSDEGACVERSLGRELHMVWVNLLKRGRVEVLNTFVERACAAEPTRPLYMSLRCPHPEAPHPWVELQSPLQDLCSDLSRSTQAQLAPLDAQQLAQQPSQQLISEVTP